MNWLVFLKYLALMAVVTYLIRVIPYILIRKEVKSKFLKSFLAYVPYTVLAAMTIPAIFTATDSVYSAVFGLLVGVVVALFEKGLLVVALSSCAAVFFAELVMKFLM